MEYLQKHWYIAIGALVVLFLLARRNSGGLTQISGGSSETALALAQITSAEREKDEERKFGLISNVLNYDLSRRGLQSQDELARIGLGQQLDLARIQADSQRQALSSQFSLAQMAYMFQQQQAQQQFDLQRYAYNQAYNTQRRNDWLGAISTGIQTIAPYLFGQTTSGGNINLPRTPPIFPSGDWNFEF
jgi:hypothetical protein